MFKFQGFKFQGSKFQGSKSFASGWFYELEGVWYKNIINKIYSGNILEIGCFEGLSLSYIKDTIISNKNNIYAVEQDRRPKLIENTTNWGVTLINKTSEEASLDFPNNFFDFIYIDANHQYEFVKKDILLWLPKLKKKGIIGGHDYDNHWPGVKQAVDEIFKQKIINGRNWLISPKFNLKLI